MVVQPPRAGTAAATSGPLAGLYAMAAKHHATWLTSMTCTIVKRGDALVPAAGRPAATSNTTYESSNWSGYQTSNTPAFTTGEWTVPAVTAPQPGYAPSYYSSAWVGIGGGVNAGSGALIQAGTGQNVINGVAQYNAWWEIVGGSGDTAGEVVLNSLAIHPGDAIWTGVQYPAGPGNTYLGVCDMTTNVCAALNHGTSAAGDSAEWIVEAPTVGGSVAPLADYGTVTFTDDCEYAVWPNGTCGAVSAGTNPSQIDLYANGQPLSVPGPLNGAGTGFTTYYE